MKTKKITSENGKRDRAEHEFFKMLENVSSKGFFGTGSITVTVQDGHIQYARVAVDRLVR